MKYQKPKFSVGQTLIYKENSHIEICMIIDVHEKAQIYSVKWFMIDKENPPVFNRLTFFVAHMQFKEIEKFEYV